MTDARIADFIREHRPRLTREAITQQLQEAGYAREEIDRTWERLATEEPINADGQEGRLGWYVWLVYLLGVVVIGLYSPVLGLQANLLGIGWVILYLVLAFFPARAMARTRARSLGGTVAIVILAPLVLLSINGGICVATIVLIASSLGY